jgi:hypothetical protein
VFGFEGMTFKEVSSLEAKPLGRDFVAYTTDKINAYVSKHQRIILSVVHLLK